MEALKKLEERLVCLVDLVKELKSANARLTEEKIQLEARLALLEGSLKTDSQRMQELNEKRILAEMMIDEMLESLGSLGSAVEVEKSGVARCNE